MSHLRPSASRPLPVVHLYPSWLRLLHAGGLEVNPGTRYGLLTFLRLATPNRFHKQPSPSGLFACDCGTEKVIPLTRVRVGNSRSCGCAMRETMRG